MNKTTYALIENYMISCMQDSAHDKEHIYRVLYNALDIANTEYGVDYDVLICACLLHDIGRKEQSLDPSLCHAQVGGEKAYRFLTDNNFDAEFAQRVKECIVSHRFRKNITPGSIEAKILFDADKLDVTGAIGIARTLLYRGETTEPLYTLMPDGVPSDGAQDERPSFFHEYHFKLKKLYGTFYTDRGRALAEQRKTAAETFYSDILNEVRQTYEHGAAHLRDALTED